MSYRISVGALLAGFVGGVALQLQQARLSPTSVFVWLAVGALVLLVGLYLARARQSARKAQASNTRWPQWLIFLLSASLAVMLGFGLTGIRAQTFQKTALDSALEGVDILVTGVVQAMPQFSEDGLRFRLKVESARLGDKAAVLPPQIYLGWYAGFGTRTPKASRVETDSTEPAAFSLELQRQPQVLRAGERWQMSVRLKAPHGNSNPHGFDYELWLWEQDLQATGYVRAGVHDAPPQKVGDSWSHPVERARQLVREAIFERIDNRQLAGVLAALVVGDQNAIERADWDVFRATGVAHLMSISGLHITMFAWLASLLLGGVWRRSVRLSPAFCLWLPAGSAGALGGLMLAALYALFSGWGVPAQRTIWMLATVILLRQGGKTWPWPFVWLLAMTVVLLLDPWALMQAGFWLSFVAVGVLFATNSGARDDRHMGATGLFDHKNTILDKFGLSQMAGALSAMLTGLLKAAREQWVVTLALTPLSLLLFNQVSLVGLLANAVAIPWVTLVVTPLAMLGVAWSPLWDVAAWSVSLLGVFLQWLARWPLATLSVAAAPLWCAIAGVVGGALLAMRLPWHWRMLGLPLLLPVLLWQPVRPAAGQFDILAADIGQGNALVLRTASHTLVYDAGPKFSRESDAGNRVLVPLLRAMGERVDMLMLSHRDTDHTGGAPAVLAMQPQATLLSSIEDGHELQALRPSTRCVQGQSWAWDGVDFEVLHPLAADYDAATKSNAMSCVLRISAGGKVALLAGDIEAPQESRLLATEGMPPKLKADFLLVPHHGSKTSSSAAFIDAVRPQFALAQAGYRNRFGHPVASVLARYQERSVTVVQSSTCGAATWRSDDAGQVMCQRQKALRYWHHQLEAPLDYSAGLQKP